MVYTSRDNNGMFTEVNLLLNAFISNGYNVEYVNLPTDKRYDVIYVFNGFESSTSNLKTLKSISGELNYLLTDSRFYNRFYSSKSANGFYSSKSAKEELYVDNYFVQSTVKMYDKPTFNSKLHMLPLYERKFYIKQESELSRVVREKGLIFGGSVRERKDEVIEYIIRPDVCYFLKFDEFGIDTRIDTEYYKRKLKYYMFGIALLNPKDIDIGNITWRYYEYLANDVLVFVDRSVKSLIDISGEINVDRFMYVSSYEEMYKKMQMIINDTHMYKTLVKWQRVNVDVDAITGKLFVKSLIEKGFKNVTR